VPFDLAIGIEVGNGGVYRSGPPYLSSRNKKRQAG